MTIYCEASGEPYEGKVAVAATFFNRVRSGRFQKTVAATCLKRFQYSEWNGDPIDNMNLMRVATVSDDDPVLADCARAYDEAAGGADPTKGATHYYSTTIAPPSWVSGTATLTAEIGHHLFYDNVQ